MTASSPLTRLVLRAMAVLAVLIVAVHALTPGATPVERIAGSAFSVATYDVAIGGARQVGVDDGIHTGDGPQPDVPDAGWPVPATDSRSGEAYAYRSYRQSHRDPPLLPIWSRGPPSA